MSGKVSRMYVDGGRRGREGLRASEQEVEEEGDEQEVQEVDEQENQDADEEQRSAQEDKRNDREDSAQYREFNGVERSGCSVGERFIPKANSNNNSSDHNKRNSNNTNKRNKGAQLEDSSNKEERSWRESPPYAYTI